MPDNNITLLAVGDIGPEIEPVDQFAELVLPVLKQADLRFANCERVYSERAASPHVAYGHGYPHPSLASIFLTAGIDILSMANNHTMKLGPEALLDTMEIFRSKGKAVIGAGNNITEARKPAIVERKGIKIAFLAYTSVLEPGHEAGPNKPGLAPMRARSYYAQGIGVGESDPGVPQTALTIPYDQDLRALQDDIKNAKLQADAVVMSIHWGILNVPKAMATYQTVVAHAAIDAGADLILGHHQHCLRAIEVYKGKVCFHGLGNFIITHKLNDFKPPSKWNSWNLWWYRVEPEYLPPNGLYDYPPDSRMTMLAKVVFSRNGVEKVAFLPAFINPRAQPAVVQPGDPKFKEILEYMEWVSDEFPHKFQVDGNEIVINAST